ncbi:MAG TPA: hypothetical protein VMU48_17255 [Terracidiphilus sp.]|nr:hypothetical protein [Terracidiphilus sp.]
MIRFKMTVLATIIVHGLTGCHVPLQSYRVQHPAIEVAPVPDPPAGLTSARVPEKDCNDANSPICLAFIEVDDMGELFDKGEVDTTLRLIRQANNIAKPGQSDPIVITFVHGWKNNASEENGNVKGFQAALQEIYKRVKGTHHVIGIYIGWRGNLIHSYFPVAQQFSYFNREATAVRIPGAMLSSALTQIATRTHENPRALAIFIGHSFGGLLLERALSQATASQIAEASIYSQEAQETKDPKETGDKLLAAKLAVDSRADLVIFINPAGAATEAKQMLDFLTFNRYTYHPLGDSTTSAGTDGSERPLFVSLTSTADLATKVALPIGHGIPYLGFKTKGSFLDLSQEPNKKYDLTCFDPQNAEHHYWELKSKEEGAPSQGAYYLSSAPHMQILQSHVMLKAVSANQMRVSSTGETIQIQEPNAIAKCDRDLFNKQKLNIVSTFRLADTQACFAIQVRPNRCNGTPYWLMEIDPDVVPDHSTIFTQRFISFIIDAFFAPNGRILERASPQLTN